jgi:hypothetical protein
VSIFKDILVANFFIKASVPLVGLGLLAAMCSNPSPETSAQKSSTSDQTLCDKAIAKYEKNSGEDEWTAKEIACKGYSSTSDRNPNIFKPMCISAVTTYVNGGGGNLEAACWPEKAAAAQNDPACSKLQDEYMSLSKDGRFYSDYMTYDRDAYADAQSKASQVINKMHELGCPNARGNVGF